MDLVCADIMVNSFVGGTNPACTFFIDKLGNDGVWYNLYLTPTPKVLGKQSAQLNSFILTGTCRIGWTLTGTPTAPTATNFSISIVGK
jgi:hypothetical protein